MSVNSKRYSFESLLGVYKVPGTEPGGLNELTKLLLTTPNQCHLKQEQKVTYRTLVYKYYPTLIQYADKEAEAQRR